MSNVQRFGAAGDGTTDDTEAIRHAVRDGDGVLHFPPGSYLITATIEIKLDESGPLGIDGSSGTARVLMTGPGPAFRVIGTHGGTGDPNSVKGSVYPKQRLPTIKNIEIEGVHPEADGIEMIETLQSVFEGVLIRRCRHGIRLTQRNRNVLISHCHIYDNTGVGIFLDHVNLHQINIASCHISYNRIGGIRIEGSQIRNLQITGNDIEYNNHVRHNTEPEPTAEIYVDTTEPGASVNEITIASNTIQATVSPDGCNIRILEAADDSERPPGLCSISGNIIGSQENNIHLSGCYGITISGNCIYSCGNRNLLIEDSRQINIGTNMFRRHTPKMGTGVRIVRSTDVTVTGCSILDEDPDGQSSGASLLELVESKRINVSGCQLLDASPYGIDAKDCSDVSITGCTIHDTREKKRSCHAIRFTGEGRGNLVGMNTIGATTESPFALGELAGVTVQGNVVQS
jgi:polygalacturonase